ncbi:hypothetical protein [Jatrophihabitans endophyticus]|uniref:hypothetical protein n=1 Tax=Jatrophihabitans endophyticus TaxID=1206085 RepID=UPI0019ED9AED|nr:hypothetical protein [Jatrophihabitans endophyticus]MBE7190305.1 hypothetical protein [Jatrophihabitans endophyticus]
MPDASEDIEYRGFKLSTVQQGGEWLVTIWPTRVEQPLPGWSDTPVMAASKDAALALARQKVDRVVVADR